MTKFSIPQTAFSGYRLLAARPVAAVFWFALYLAVVFGKIALMVAMAGPQLAAMQAMRSSGAPPDPATSLALAGPVMLASLVSLIITVLVAAIAYGAVSRAVLRPGESRFGYLRFGADEFRLLAVILVMAILIWVAYMVAFVPVMAALFAVGGAERTSMALQGAGSLPAKAIGMAVLAALPGVALFVFLGVKLALAPAQTVAERGVRIFGSWALTKGIFWRSLATYALAAVPVLLIAIIYVGVVLAVHQGGVSGGLKGMMRPDLGSMGAAFGPTQILTYVIGALMGTLSMAGMLAPPAVIYGAVAVRSTEAMADVFGADDDDDED